MFGRLSQANSQSFGGILRKRTMSIDELLSETSARRFDVMLFFEYGDNSHIIKIPCEADKVVDASEMLC